MNVCKAVMLFVVCIILSISARVGESEDNPVYIDLGTDPVYINCIYAQFHASDPYLYYRFHASTPRPILKLEVVYIDGRADLDLVMDQKNPVTGVWEVLDDDGGLGNRPAASIRINDYNNNDHFIRIRMYSPGQIGTDGTAGVGLELIRIPVEYIRQ